jgi:hypothetical protein
MKIQYQGRGGYIECEKLRFEIELMASGPAFAIYFPRRKYDKKLSRIRKSLDELVAREPERWIIHDYDGPHGFYDGMTVNERLFIAEVMDDLDNAIEQQDYEKARAILLECDLSYLNSDAIIESLKKKED